MTKVPVTVKLCLPKSPFLFLPWYAGRARRNGRRERRPCVSPLHGPRAKRPDLLKSGIEVNVVCTFLPHPSVDQPRQRNERNPGRIISAQGFACRSMYSANSMMNKPLTSLRSLDLSSRSGAGWQTSRG